MNVFGTSANIVKNTNTVINDPNRFIDFRDLDAEEEDKKNENEP